MIRNRQEEIATSITLEQGKPIAQARLEVIRGAEFFEWDAGVQTAAISGAVRKMRNAGQVCMSPTRFFAQESILTTMLRASLNMPKQPWLEMVWTTAWKWARPPVIGECPS
ncbi:aldehyde dehydrogenase family protein [uncultured Tateyamaria sp.]|uniref:aldehyde dehydrogenase family protein n=1 Tax=uncultured Tateyamaria sp. TaxID=455651 RepID=UPI002624B5E5|nr:aldehyde dehydrogenase family protein [uncultured Tateyamaria sp.]